jgi:hypothetical protein
VNVAHGSGPWRARSRRRGASSELLGRANRERGSNDLVAHHDALFAGHLKDRLRVAHRDALVDQVLLDLGRQLQES